MPLLYAQAHELTWGEVALDVEVAPDLPYRIDTIAAESSLGNPIPLVEVVDSMLTDGSLSKVTSYGNREVTFRVRISAPDGLALAQGEAAFMAEVMAEQPSPLVWRPPSGDAWPCVFDVVTVKFDGDYSDGWDLDEVMRACLYYTLTFECLPWTHPEETVIVPALEVPEDPDADPIVESVNTASSLTGWARKISPTSWAWSSLTGPTVVSGGVRTTGTLAPGSGYGWLSLELDQTVAMGDTPYLIVDIEKSASNSQGGQGAPDLAVISARFTGSQLDEIKDPVQIAPTSDPAVDRYYFLAPANFDQVLVRLRVQRLSTSRAVVLRVVDVSRTDRLGLTGTDGYQMARTVVVGGTAPTQAAVRFATTLDGDPGADELMTRTAMVYTGTNPAVALRPLVFSSAAAGPDAATVSGQSNDLSAPTIARIPVSSVSEATYAIFARLKFTGEITVAWSANLVDSTGADFPGSEVVESGEMLLSNDNDVWAIHQLGTIPLPILANLSEGSTHLIKLSISMASGGASVDLDDAWLLDDDNGAVTVINTTASTGPYKLELRSPQLDSPRPAVVGTWADYGSQDVTRMAARMGTHLFKPGLLYLLTVADGKKYAACELEYFERFHTRPGPALVVSETS